MLIITIFAQSNANLADGVQDMGCVALWGNRRMPFPESLISQTFKPYLTLCSLLVVPRHLLPLASSLPLLEHDKDSTAHESFGIVIYYSLFLYYGVQ